MNHSEKARDLVMDWVKSSETPKSAEVLIDQIKTALTEASKDPSSDAEKIALWLEGLSRHPSCPPERRYWYEGVAGDIRNRNFDRLKA